LLNIALVRVVPEALKPRRIAIDGDHELKVVDRKAA